MAKKIKIKISSRLSKKRNKRFAGGQRKQSKLSNVAFVDYKDTDLLKNFLTERGKILPSRISGNCAAKQRELTKAIKLARIMALLPFCQHDQ